MRLQHADVTTDIRAKVKPQEPHFTYNFASPKGRPAPVITQDNKAPTASAPPIKRRSERMNQSISPRTEGIVVAALQPYVRNAFIEEMIKNKQNIWQPI